jgi:hypothetical protein
VLEVEIHIQGHLESYRVAWFSNLTVRHDREGNTLLSGSIKDQAELRGLLNWLADLGLELISVTTDHDAAPKEKGKEVRDR